MRDYAELIKRLRSPVMWDDGEDCVACEMLQDEASDAIEELLDELTTIRKQLPHWISVEERLPEEEKPVFVTYIGYNTGSLHSDMIAYQDGEGDWRYYDGDNGSDICKVDITHWMPLPAPPKGGNHDN